MTVPDQENPQTEAIGNGVATVFDFDFLCLLSQDLRVSVDGTVTDPSEYAVGGLGEMQGGTVTFVTAPADGARILMELAVVPERQTDYQDNGDFFATTVNFDFDRLWLALQQAFSWMRRAITLPVEFPPRNSTVPPVAARARKALIFDDNGNVTVGKDDYEDQAENAAESAAQAAASASAAAAARDAAQEIANDFGDLDGARAQWEAAVQQSQTAAAEAEADANRAEAAADASELFSKAVLYFTLTGLQADTSPAGTLGVVMNDPDPANNGYYLTDGTTWTKTELQPADRDAVDAIATQLLLKVGYGRVALTQWGETSKDIDVDGSAIAAGGNDVLDDHEARLTNAEIAGTVQTRVALTQWGEVSRAINLDLNDEAAGGEDVQESHEIRITALENGGGGGGGPLEVDGFLGQGQSNGRGAMGAPPDAATSTPIYPSKILMPGGPGMNVVCGTAGGENYGPIDPANFQNFQALKSMDLGSGSGSTYLEGLGFAMGLAQAGDNGVRTSMLMSTAKGGASLANRSPGTVPYDNTLIALDRAVAITAAMGGVYTIKAITSIEGEADSGNTAYADDLETVYAGTLTADILARTGQKNLPPILLAQPSSFFASVDGVMGIYEVCKRNPRFFLVAPGYFLPYASDLLHYTNRGHVKMGEYFHKAWRQIRQLGWWKPVMPKLIKWDGGTGLDVWFHVPKPPLVLDLAAPNHGNFGFDIRVGGVAQTIASIEQVAPDQLHFETAAPLGANRVLRYAMRGYQSSPRQPGDGPMGSLRDSDDTPSFTDGAPLYNWCVHFSEAF